MRSEKISERGRRQILNEVGKYFRVNVEIPSSVWNSVLFSELSSEFPLVFRAQFGIATGFPSIVWSIRTTPSCFPNTTWTSELIFRTKLGIPNYFPSSAWKKGRNSELYLEISLEIHKIFLFCRYNPTYAMTKTGFSLLPNEYFC